MTPELWSLLGDSLRNVGLVFLAAACVLLVDVDDE